MTFSTCFIIFCTSKPILSCYKNLERKHWGERPLGLRQPSPITFAFRSGQVVRKMLDLLHKKCKLGGVRTSVGIFPGPFQFSSPGTFGLLQSRDHGIFKVSRSFPVQSRDLGPLVIGLPGTSWDLFGRLFEKKICKKSVQRYIFFYFCKFFSKIINF